MAAAKIPTLPLLPGIIVLNAYLDAKLREIPDLAGDRRRLADLLQDNRFACTFFTKKRFWLIAIGHD